MFTALIPGPSKAPSLTPERAPEKKKRWWQRTTDAEILRSAKDVLDERGWIKGSWVGKRNGGVCLLGAIGIAALDAGRKDRWMPGNAPWEFHVISAASKITGSTDYFWLWNDMEARNVGDVKQKLEKMAQRAEANGGKYPRGQ